MIVTFSAGVNVLLMCKGLDGRLTEKLYGTCFLHIYMGTTWK